MTSHPRRRPVAPEETSVIHTPPPSYSSTTSSSSIPKPEDFIRSTSEKFLADQDQLSEKNSIEKKLSSTTQKVAALLNKVAARDEEIAKLKATSLTESQMQMQILSRLEKVLISSEKEKERSSTRICELRQKITNYQDTETLLLAENRGLKETLENVKMEKMSWHTRIQDYRTEMASLRNQVDTGQEELVLASQERRQWKVEKKKLLKDVKRLDVLVYGRG